MEVKEELEIEIQPGQRARDSGFESLYKRTFPVVAGFVRTMNGSQDQARDIFHDALIIYRERIEGGKFQLWSDPEAYILGIAKHLWIRKFSRDRKFISFTALEHEIRIPDDYFPTIDTTRLMNFLERTGKKCLDLLHAFYFEKKNLSEISSLLHYGHEHSASVQKYKCIEKLRDQIKEKSAAYEDFIE